jgi:hypothetical protein
MATTFDYIAQASGTNSATIQINSIPQTYTDLILIANLNPQADDIIRVIFNGESQNSYYWNSQWTDVNTNGEVQGGGGVYYQARIGNANGILMQTIPNYTLSIAKSMPWHSCRDGANATPTPLMYGTIWGTSVQTTAAPITSLTVSQYNNSAVFPSYSKVYLFGVKAA